MPIDSHITYLDHSTVNHVVNAIDLSEAILKPSLSSPRLLPLKDPL